MNAFERHGIKHLSPSSINCWRETPGLWCLRYLQRIRDDGSPAMWRGTAVEAGMERLLRGQPLQPAVGAALEAFEAAAVGEITDGMDAERKLIPKMVERVCDWHADLLATNQAPELAATQLRIETYLDGVSVPVIGYVDFTFMDGPDLDLKTTKACPSAPRPDHLRQIALYHRARQRPGALLYVTDKRMAYYVPSATDLANALGALTDAARSLERFLTHIPDADAAVRMMPHPTDHWSYGEATRAKVSELLEAF